MMIVGDAKVMTIVFLGILVGETFGLYLKRTRSIASSNTLHNENLEIRKERDIHVNHPSVHHYARHGLCRTFKGKQHLYNAMKKNICGMKLSFIANLVVELCRMKNTMLDTWVAGLFDVDDDGTISHYERNLYNDT